MKPRKFGLRHLLPIVETVLYFALWMTGSSLDVRRSELNTPRRHEPQLVYVQEGTGLDWRPQRPPSFSIPTKLAMCLNLPAFLVAAVLCSVLHRESVMSLFYISGLLALPIWYGLGRWLDRQIGFLPAAKPWGQMGAFLTWALSGLSVLIFVLSVYAAIANRHNGEQFLAVGFIVWASVFMLGMAVALRRRLASHPADWR